MRLHNSLTGRVEPFEPLHAGEVRMYNCGPTVYKRQHIGNFRAFTMADLLRRTFEMLGLRVTQIMNITDVGHLTDDADEGEDKLAKAAAERRITAWEIAERYTKSFFEFSDLLNILPKRHIMRATDHIPEQIELIQRLEGAGVVYTTDDGVYFDTTKIEDYGKLTPTDDRTQQQAGVRVAVGEKRSPTDFALWKFSPPDGPQRDMEWESPWGTGFPGWHVECSAMAMKYLGETLDVHIGGIDHIPVHHTNEIAQSEAATGKPFSRFWMHGAFLELPGEQKMAKSAGDDTTIRTLQEMGYDPLAFRYLVLLSHYRKPLDFSYEGLDAAATAFARLRERTREVSADPELRALVVTGSGKAFAAGADIAEMKAMEPGQAAAFSRLGHAAFAALEALPIPTLAAVNGFALGGGCELACACDWIYAARRARFGQPEVNLGVIPGAGGTQRLVRAVGKALAMEMVLNDRRLTAHEAYAFGLVNRVYPEADFEDRVAMIAADLARARTHLQAMAKRSFHAGWRQSIEEASEHEIRNVLASLERPRFREALEAFLDKRTRSDRLQVRLP